MNLINRPYNINIILPVASRGLLNDADIIKHAIQQNNPNIYVRIISKEKGYFGLLLKLLNFLIHKSLLVKQVTFHLEEIQPFFSKLSIRNFFIPNQEWLRGTTKKNMNKYGMHTLCKTQYAYERLKNKTERISYLGFTSKNRHKQEPIRDFKKCLHIAGKSPQKGTLPLLNLWASKTNWPLLTVITTLSEFKMFNKFNNIEIISEFITEDELDDLLNQHGIHICPSEAEGFGHSIVEGMSVGACVLTTNGPPMNELVADERCLIQHFKVEQRYSSEVFFVNELALEDTITTILNWSQEELEESGLLSMTKYKSLNEAFHQYMSKTMMELEL